MSASQNICLSEISSSKSVQPKAVGSAPARTVILLARPYQNTIYTGRRSTETDMQLSSTA